MTDSFEILKSIAVQSPMVVAALVLCIAAVLKIGKERGAVAILVGAAGLLLLSIAGPVVYLGIMPRMVETTDAADLGGIYLTVNLLFNLCWAVAVILIAVGIMLRPPARPPVAGGVE